MMTRNIRPLLAKRVPQRTCVACREVKPKGELIRLVRIARGGLEVDTTGKKVGRGAYLCREQKCLESGLKGRLEYSLKTVITGDNRERLVEFWKSFLRE